MLIWSVFCLSLFGQKVHLVLLLGPLTQIFPQLSWSVSFFLSFIFQNLSLISLAVQFYAAKFFSAASNWPDRNAQFDAAIFFSNQKIMVQRHRFRFRYSFFRFRFRFEVIQPLDLKKKFPAASNWPSTISSWTLFLPPTSDCSCRPISHQEVKFPCQWGFENPIDFLTIFSPALAFHQLNECGASKPLQPPLTHPQCLQVTQSPNSGDLLHLFTINHLQTHSFDNSFTSSSCVSVKIQGWQCCKTNSRWFVLSRTRSSIFHSICFDLRWASGIWNQDQLPSTRTCTGQRSVWIALDYPASDYTLDCFWEKMFFKVSKDFKMRPFKMDHDGSFWIPNFQTLIFESDPFLSRDF